MANLTSLSTFFRTVMGNKVVVYAHVPGGRSTDDSIVPPHLTAIDFVSGCYRSSAVAASSSAPSFSFEGTTVQIFTVAGTTATPLVVKFEGR